MVPSHSLSGSIQVQIPYPNFVLFQYVPELFSHFELVYFVCKESQIRSPFNSHLKKIVLDSIRVSWKACGNVGYYYYSHIVTTE